MNGGVIGGPCPVGGAPGIWYCIGEWIMGYGGNLCPSRIGGAVAGGVDGVVVNRLAVDSSLAFCLVMARC